MVYLRKYFSRGSQICNITEELDRCRTLINDLPVTASREMDPDKLTQKVEAEKEIKRLNEQLAFLKSPAYFRDQVLEREGSHTNLDHIEVRPIHSTRCSWY
jgi:hypothetical protein